MRQVQEYMRKITVQVSEGIVSGRNAG